MLLTLPPYTKSRGGVIVDTPSRLFSKATYKRKRLNYVTILPAFTLANTWRGASEIIKEFRFEREKNFALNLTEFEKPSDANYCPCIAWKPTSETIVRYKLWADVGEILYVPLYTGQTIGKNFSIEIWNTNNAFIGSAEEVIVLTSILTIPDSICDLSNIYDVWTYEDCTDVTFLLGDGSVFEETFVPADGDYYVVVGDCGTTMLIKSPVVVFDFLILQSTDLTWHEVSIIETDGEFFLGVNQSNTIPGVQPSISLRNSIDGLGYALGLVLIDGEHYLSINQSPVPVDYNTVYLLNGSLYYGIRTITIDSQVTFAVGQIGINV